LPTGYPQIIHRLSIFTVGCAIAAAGSRRNPKLRERADHEAAQRGRDLQERMRALAALRGCTRGPGGPLQGKKLRGREMLVPLDTPLGSVLLFHDLFKLKHL